ncbi:MAG TPA: hypothetical protein VGC79_28060 [Polyangiaceae bacterium]
MLKLAVAVLGIAGCAIPLAARAQGEEAEDGLRRPERLTIGTGDQFLGQLTPDGKTLYFVSNRETRKQIYAQDIEQGRVRLAFDEASDVTWPRVSPDGKALLYVSFSEQATGELCVRDLPDGEGRRCLAGTGAALQAEWIDNQRIAVVERKTIGANFRLLEVHVAAQLTQHALYERNWTGLAVSPNARWLVYVPLDRVTEHVGPGFAARAAPKLAAVRLDRKAPPVELALDLPGMSGQPAFSRDGQFLYWVQFFSDSNHDGAIDANDHGVLFRVPFATTFDDAPARTAALMPVQLTDSSSNCQYPAPGAKALVATCSRGPNLTVYSLPLDGEIPSAWTAQRLRDEIELSARRSEQLLLYRHALARRADARRQRLIMMRLVMAHLELEQFPAAEFYAKKIAALRDPSTRGIGRPLLVLVEQRKARSALERGRTLDSFGDETVAQLAQLRDGPKDSPATRVFNQLVRSELADSLGDKARAKRELEATNLTDDTPEGVLEAYHARADALYRELDDRESLVALCRKLALHPKSAPGDRLEYARAAARALLRGLAIGEATAVLDRERQTEAADSEFGFALDLSRVVLAIQNERPGPAVKAALITLYEAQGRLDRKRAIMLDAIERAAEVGADSLIEALSERYVRDVAVGTGERRRAEQLYRRAIIGRAFRRLAKGRAAEARADFDAVFRLTGSFQAASASIELRLGEGQSAAAIATELSQGARDPSAIAHFVEAAGISHELGKLSDAAHADAVARARAALRASWAALKNKAPVRALYGALMHQEYLRSGSPAAAEMANSHYLVALDRGGDDPRLRATLLDDLGLLQAQVGNYRIALGYFEQRDKLPYGPNASALAVHLAHAEALLHLGKEQDAAALTERALATLGQAPTLAAYGTLTLDRSALANLAAGHYARALTLYDAELPRLSANETPSARRNRFVVRLAHAAAAVGSGSPQVALADLNQLEPRLEEPRFVQELAPAHVSPEQAGATYRALANGLRAQASAALGQLDASAAALVRRHALIEARYATSQRDEDLRALTLVETQLADNARARRDLPAAARWIGLALKHADALVAGPQAPPDVDQLRVLWFAAELQTFDHARLSFDLRQRLSEAQQKLAAQRGRALRMYKRWFEIFLALEK